MKVLFACLVLFGGGVAFSVPVTAQAQSLRVYVSGTGDDANDCAVATPCRTFAGALTKVGSRGEINCLDTASFGAVTINKAVTIDCVSNRGKITAGGTNAINISAGASDEVRVRGIDIVGSGAASGGGLRVNSGGRVTLSDLTVTNTLNPAITIMPAGAMKVELLDSLISENAGGAILARGASPSTLLTLSVVNVRAAHSTYGMRLEDNVRASVERSSLINNENNGLLVVSGSEVSIAWVSSSNLSNNGINGVATSGAKANVRLAYSSVTGNTNGINSSGGGSILSTSPATNAIYGNQSMNTPTGTVPLQ